MQTTKLIVVSLVLGAAPAVAQEPPAPAPQPAPAPEAPPPVASPDAPAPAPASAELEEKLSTLEGRIEGINEPFLETKATVDSLKKIKVSGYIQGRYEWHEDSKNGLKSDGTPATTNQFLVRRGRVKTAYEGKNAEFVLQFDATGRGVTLKDAEASFVEPWTGMGLKLTAGQFKWPFGYEVLQSSGEREMPERSLVIRRLFPGERDRGVRLQARHEWLRFAAAVVNGNGTEDRIFTASDQSQHKDVVGRLGGDFESVVVGLSGYYGHHLKTTAPGAFKVSGTDADGDGKIVGSEITFTPATPATYERYSKLRLGADAQVYVDVPSVGGLAVKGELIWAKDGHMDFATEKRDPAKDVTSYGWYIIAVQNIGDTFGLVLRVDQFNPNKDKDAGKKVLADMTTLTVGGGALVHLSGNAKLTLVYEHPTTDEPPLVMGMAQVTDPRDDVFTAQLQVKF